MKLFKYIASFILLASIIVIGCKKETTTDTSFVAAATSVNNLSVMFNITQDNTGLVTITPNGTGAVYYDVSFGDTTKNAVTINAGMNVKHIYPEGNYQVKLVGHDIKGGTATLTQALVVSFIAPKNLVVNVATSKLTVNVSATAQYATFYKVYYGDSNNVVPIPYASALANQVVSHTYAKAGTYVVKVVALSGGAATTQFLDTITVANQINLPVTFEDPNTDYTMSDFGGALSSLAIDPANASNHVIKSVKTAGAQTWAGVTIGTALGFANPIPLTKANPRMTVMVYSPAVGLDIKLKVEDHNDATHSVETDVLSTVANKWETITFDFSHQATGTAAFSSSYNYDKASIFFDFNNSGTGKTFYFDNVQMAPPPLAQLNLPVTFESTTVDYTMTDFGGNSSTPAIDPSVSSNHVMKSTKTAGAQTWAGTTIGTASGFATAIPLTATATKMSVRVFSPAAGIDIKLKVEDHNNGANSVETDVLTTVVNGWETLTFDFSKPASGTAAWNASYTYDKASIFFDFGNVGDGRSYYWDDVKMIAAPVLSQINLPVTFESSTVDYTVTDFGSNVTIPAIDPVVSTNHVMQTTKPSGAQTWAGTTIGTALGFASPIALTATRTKMTVRVYSPAAGIDIKLKVEDHNDGTHSVETDVLTTVANGWQTLTFDFSKPASGTTAWNASYTYDKASIFFDFGNAGSGKMFYWDDVIFL